MNTPTLRFKEFSGAWEVKKLGDVFKITSGTTPLRANAAYFENGQNSWVKTTDLNNGRIIETSQIITRLPKVHKVLFVVDRKDLDYQTSQEFNAFSKGCVDNTSDTNKLVAQLTDDSCKLIVTTIQKLNNAKNKPLCCLGVELLILIVIQKPLPLFGTTT